MASYRGETSYYFDVENDCFEIMPMPQLEDGETGAIRFFWETGGWLFLVNFHEASTAKFDAYMLEHEYSICNIHRQVTYSVCDLWR